MNRTSLFFWGCATAALVLLSSPVSTGAQERAPAAEAETTKPEPADSKTDAPAVKPEAGHAETPGHSHAAGADHKHDAGHDEFDKTHANASPNISQPQEIRFDQAVATFIIFVLLAAILAKFAWGPIVDGLDKREAGIAKMIDDARLAQQQAEAQLRSYEAKLAAATEEARSMVAQARLDAANARERDMAAAKEEAEKLLQRAKSDIEAAKRAALQEIAEKSVNTAITLASNIVRREVKPEDHDRLVSDALSQFSKLN